LNGRQAKEGIEVVNQATEIKLRAERKAGQFLREMPKAKPIGNNQYKSGCVPTRNTSTLPEMGITHKQSSQWQKVASIPDEKFERQSGNY